MQKEIKLPSERKDALVAAADRLPAALAARLMNDAILTKLVRPWINPLLPQEVTAVTIRSGAGRGLRLVIYPRQEKYYWTGTHESPVQRLMTERLKAGMCFWDVGAHVGFFSFIASRLVGSNGHVISFEPVEQNRDRLRAGISINALDNVAVRDVALAGRSGSSPIYPHASSLMWSLVPNSDVQHMSGRVVATSTLNLTAERELAPNFIKIDVEGAELDVLRGGQEWLKHAKPELIVEFNSDDLVHQALREFPFYSFQRLSRNHWWGH